eukprot:12637920-Heterocapsa_arctica.AAC.1
MGGDASRFVIRGGGRSAHKPSAALPRPAGRGRARVTSSPAAEALLRNRGPSVTLVPNGSSTMSDGSPLTG